MNIRATEYTREDRVTLIQHTEGKWLVRKIFGPSWFYLKDHGWKYGPALSAEELDACALPFDEGYALLETVVK